MTKIIKQALFSIVNLSYEKSDSHNSFRHNAKARFSGDRICY